VPVAPGAHQGAIGAPYIGHRGPPGVGVRGDAGGGERAVVVRDDGLGRRVKPGAHPGRRLIERHRDERLGRSQHRDVGPRGRRHGCGGGFRGVGRGLPCRTDANFCIHAALSGIQGGRHRQGLGVHDRDEGQRHSRVDFHSFRRRLITGARKGFDRSIVAAIVGHENGNITDDTYNAGPDMDTKRRCVESVKLPVGTQQGAAAA
jgi:hypothetical protein